MKNSDKYKNITIVVNSCDKFKDAWEPFFVLLDKYWLDHPRKVLLNSETIEYDGSAEYVKTILNSNNKSWTERIRNTVKQVETEFVLFFLEDYFIWDYVNESIFNEALQLMQSDDKTGAVIFHGVSRDEKFNTKFDSDSVFVEQKQNLISRAHVCITLFRKDFLMKMFYADENPWRYERESYARSIALKKKIFAQNYGCSSPCFLYYLKPRDNIGINQGKWLKDTIPMFEKNDITNIDYNNLGVYDEYLRPHMDKDMQKLINKGVKEILHEKVIKKIKYSMAGRKIKAIYYGLYYTFLYKDRG